MKTFFKFIGILLICVLLAGVGFYLWAGFATNRVLAETYEVHAVDFPIPFALTEEERAEALQAFLDSATVAGNSAVTEAGFDADQVALARAVARGEHLVTSRYACIECHGSNFGGGTMIDAFPIGTLLGPNLTTGTGSRTLQYTATDWDRIVRHGVKPSGAGSVMPSEDFQLMSDQELSDIIAYIRSLPPVNNEVPPVVFGPVGKILVATNQLVPSAKIIPSHTTAHLSTPPRTEVSLEFGGHVAGVCTGCHREDLAGGPIIGGDPSWLPAANLTSHGTGLGAWSFDDFSRAMREGVRPDGTTLGAPMDMMGTYTRRMTDVELEALWMYLRSLPPVASRN